MTDWNQWRADYRTMSFTDQQTFYARVGLDHPHQQDYELDRVRAFLLGSGVGVVAEVGGWNGSLGCQILNEGLVEVWTNYEICPTCPQVCERLGYRHVLLNDFPWNRPLNGDALVLSHVVEHMLVDEFDLLLGQFLGDYLYIDCPVGEEAQDWSGYDGSHIIDGGWTQIEQVTAAHGFHPQTRFSPTICTYTKE